MTQRTKRLIASLVSAALVVGLVVLVVTDDVDEKPVFVSLQQNPDPTLTGTIAYATYDSERRGCLWVVPASGVSPPHQVMCGLAEGYSEWVFDPSGNLVVADAVDISRPGPVNIRVFDVSTNLVLSTFVRPPGDNATRLSMDTSMLVADADGDSGLRWPFGSSDGTHRVWVARAGDEQHRRVSMTAPVDYRFSRAFESPDGKLIAITEIKGGILIVDPSGRVRELVRTPDLQTYESVAWFQVGLTKGTVDADALQSDARQPRT